MSQEPGYAVDVPQVVGSYAAYLETRTRAEPEVIVLGSHAAEVSLTWRDKTLVLTFGCRNREWALDSAEIQCGEQVTTFARGELAEAVAALLAT